MWRPEDDAVYMYVLSRRRRGTKCVELDSAVGGMRTRYSASTSAQIDRTGLATQNVGKAELVESQSIPPAKSDAQ